MAEGMGNIGAAQAAALQGAQFSPSSTNSKTLENPTEPKFGEVLKKLQSQYGAKTEKPREVKKTLGKDDFLRIMITQMKNQDPSNPFKAEQMATEMAQFTSVEQMQNMNQTLTKMSTNDKPSERLAMTHLIGKTITVDRGRFPHAEGGNESLGFNLSKNAAEVKIALISESGEVVLEKDLGAQKAGEGSFSWDGLKSNRLPAKAGNYILRVEAKDDRGATLDTNSQTKARVIGVSFEGQEPVFLVGDAKQQVKITMKNIVRIDESSNPSAPAMANSAGATPSTEGVHPAESASANEAPKNNFFSFQKGVGSGNMDPAQVSAEAAEALARFQAQQQGAAKSAAPVQNVPIDLHKNGVNHAKNEEKGFPNGLHD